MKSLKLKSSSEDGVSLIEVVVVVVIIAILVAIAVPIYINHKRQAYISELKSDIASTAIATGIYYDSSDNGTGIRSWPTGSTFNNLIVNSDPAKNTITIFTYPGTDGVQQACIQGVRNFSATDTVTWSYSMTSKTQYLGACKAETVLPAEVPN